MKKIVTIFILMVMVLNISIVSIANTQIITKEELKSYFEKFLEEDGTEADILISDNKIEMTEKQTNVKAEMQFDLENNEFYSEPIFTRDITKEEFYNNMSELIIMPTIGFFAISDKLGVEEDIYEQYAMENGVGEEIIATTIMVNEAEQTENFDAIALLEKYITEDETSKEEYKYYSIEKEIVKIDENTMQMKFKIKVNEEQDFSKMKDELKNLVQPEINKENADIYISLKVGETYIVEEDKKFYGYSFLEGGQVVDINISEHVITAKEMGTAYGYLYFVENDEDFIIEEGENLEIETISKTVYIEVKENYTENNNDNNNNNNGNLDDNNNKENDNTKADSELPNTGRTMLVGVITIIVFGFLVISVVKYRRIN